MTATELSDTRRVFTNDQGRWFGSPDAEGTPMNQDGNHHDEDPPALSLSDRVRSLKLNNAKAEQSRGGASWLPWLLVLLLAGGCGYLGYVVYFGPESPSESSSKASSSSPSPSNGDGNSTSGPAPKPGSVALDAGGYIIPIQKVQVSPKVGGQVIWLHKNLEEGTLVDEGVVIARLDPTKYKYEYERAQAFADQAKAEYEELKNGSRDEEKKHSAASLKEAEEARRQLADELNRLRQSGRAASDEERIKVESRLKQADQKVEQLRQMDRMMQDGPRKEKIQAAWAKYQQAVVRMNDAKYDLDNCEVKSSVTGMILEKKCEVGNTVRPESFGQGLSASLCDMADLTKLEVDVDVSERDLLNVFAGQKCRIRPEAFGNKQYDGVVSRLMPIASRSKASVSVRVRIEVPKDERDAHGGLVLRPEMRARVHFLAEAAPGKEITKAK